MASLIGYLSVVGREILPKTCHVVGNCITYTIFVRLCTALVVMVVIATTATIICVTTICMGCLCLRR